MTQVFQSGLLAFILVFSASCTEQTNDARNYAVNNKADVSPRFTSNALQKLGIVNTNVIKTLLSQAERLGWQEIDVFTISTNQTNGNWSVWVTSIPVEFGGNKMFVISKDGQLIQSTGGK